jgi:hypothetical protein
MISRGKTSPRVESASYGDGASLTVEDQPKDVAERPQAYFRPASTNDLEWLKAARRLVRHRAKVGLELSEAEARLKIGRLRFRG